MNRKLEVTKEFRFEAAHVLPRHPGKCSKLHGHSWLLRVGVRAPINPATGFVVDFIDLKALVQPLIEQWDHSFLGADTAVGNPSFNGYPSSENLVMHVVNFVREQLYRLDQTIEGDVASLPELSLVEIEETCTSRCTWRNV